MSSAHSLDGQSTWVYIHCHGDSFLLHLVLLFCPSLSLPVIHCQISASPSNDVLNIAPPCALSLLSGYVATRLYQEGTIMKGIYWLLLYTSALLPWLSCTLQCQVVIDAVHSLVTAGVLSVPLDFESCNYYRFGISCETGLDLLCFGHFEFVFFLL